MLKHAISCTNGLLQLLVVTASGYPQQLHTQHFAGVMRHRNPFDSHQVILHAML
jgi:hypothetical protein